VIRDRVAAGVDLVVNLAAGLDTRPYRMELPASLRWVEVDLPDMIRYKESSLDGETPVCSLERIALDLADREARRDLLGRLASRGHRGLVLTEGLLIYLEPQQVGDLASDLAAATALRDWVTDLSSPGLLRWLSSTWGKEVEAAGAPFRFAPEEGPEHFSRFGWRPISVQSTFHAAAALRRLPLWMRPFSWLPEPRRWKPQRVWSGTCLLERS
jgi:methyltransferase (TIGR00027 family)